MLQCNNGKSNVITTTEYRIGIHINASIWLTLKEQFLIAAWEADQDVIFSSYSSGREKKTVPTKASQIECEERTPQTFSKFH